MDLLKELSKVLASAQMQLSKLINNNVRATRRKKGDFTRFTVEQLEHLLDVYTNSLHSVKTYTELATYGNKKYGLDKATVTYYDNLSKYRIRLKNL